MQQTRLTVQSTRASAEALFAALDAAFEDEGLAVGLREIDEAEARFEVEVYVEDDPALLDACRAQMEAAIASLAIKAEVEAVPVPDMDWVTHSLRGLSPVRAGRFLVHGSHDRAAVRGNDIAIEIEAGRAFGTGHHGTTAGCLELISRIAARRRPLRSLDLGAGSAVLAIAVARLCHTQVLATDIDPVAVQVAINNVRLNGAASLVHCIAATGFNHRAFVEQGPFDLIIANILPGPLMAMAPQIAGHLAAGGDVILSGILTHQRNKVLAAFRLQGLVHHATLVRGEWVSLHLRARA